MPAPDVAAFRQSVDSGLYVAPEFSRVREVWTQAEWKLLNRFTTLMHRHGIQVQLQCQRPTCQDAPLEASNLADGSLQLQCAHATRVLMHAF